MSTPEIRSREDFFRSLTSTTAEIDNLVAREPAYPVWGLLQRQLHAMREWTMNGADPTAEQRERDWIGLVAARELEPAADAAMQDLVTRLHLLNYYCKRWPSVELAAPVAQRLLLAESNSLNAPNRTKLLTRLLYPPLNMAILLLISFVLFTAACCLPALEFRNSDKPHDIMLGLRA